MKLLTGLICFLAISASQRSFAQISQDDAAKQSLAQLQTSYEDTETAMFGPLVDGGQGKRSCTNGCLDGKLTDLEQKTEKAKKDMDDLRSQENPNNNIFHKNSDALKALKAKYQDLKKQTQGVQAQMRAGRQSADIILNQQQMTGTQVGWALKWNGVEGKFAQVLAREGSLDAALSRLEDQYDSANIGAYMRKKMANLLNSKAFCDETRNCTAGKPGIKQDQIDEEIFPRMNFNSPASAPTSTTK